MGKRLYRRSFLSILIAMFLVCGIMGLTMMFSHTAARAEEEVPPDSTFYLGESGIDDTAQKVYYRPNFEEGWGEVVRLATAVYERSPSEYVKVVLARDWVATANSVDGFGKSTSYFKNGRIYVPEGTNITIDLNGHKIDRNLSAGISNGQVLYVQGNLTIKDSEGGGVITGGFNAPSDNLTYGGGIFVEDGHLTLKSGSIEGNRVGGSTIYGIGVYVRNSGSFNMYGGTIKNHNFATATNAAYVYGGGVCVNGASTFNMYGGVIENNTAMNGGGVAAYYATGTVVNIEGGIIRNNHASGSTPTDKTQNGGGGVFVQYSGDTYIKGGEICNNTSNQYGGGVFVLTNQASILKFAISGGHIHDNEATALNNSVAGGGVAVGIFNQRSVTINAEMTDGTIENNKAIANGNNLAQGGGLYVFCSTFEMKGGSIINNSAEGTNSYGGGVHAERPLTNTWIGKNNPFILSGGTISGNRANRGAGVNVNGLVEIKGGKVTGNKAPYSAGVHLDTYARLSLAGNPVIYDNLTTLGDGTAQSNLQISAADDRRPQVSGAFKDGARIGVVVNGSFAEDGEPFIKGYGVHNSEFVSVNGKAPDSDTAPTNGAWLYTNPYRYFVSDTAYVADGQTTVQQVTKQHILVLSDGELGVSPKEVKFTVKYKDNSTKDYILGKADQEELSWNCVDTTYGDSNYVTLLSAPDFSDVADVTVNQAAGVYPITVKLDIGGEKEVEFAVVVRAKKLANSEVTVTLSNDGFKYDGSPKIPQTCVVRYNNRNMVAGVEYTLSYENNINAGEKTAVVIVTFKGNYAGEVRAYFTIESSASTSKFTQVKWEILSGEEWITFASSAYGSTFTYDATNQNAKIRASLTVPDLELPQTVYAYGVEVEDDLRNAGMWLEFNGNKSVEFKNAGEYAIEIRGYANYPIALGANIISGVSMKPQMLSIKESDFDEIADAAQTRLWQLKIGEGVDAVYTTLVDMAIYEDPDAKENEFGEKITHGQLMDAYARYRGVVLGVVLNGNFNFGEKYLQEWLTFDKDTTVTYTSVSDKGDTVGTLGGVSKITTTVKIDFGGNYVLDNGTSYLEITKIWYIVTMSNNLRDANTCNTVAQTALDNWTFGTAWQELTVHFFRPEHGDTVIYSYYLIGSDKLVKQFAVVYSNDTYNASINYFNVKTEGGRLAADRNSPINDSNYLYTVHHGLKAGSYRMEVTVPQNAPLAGEHRHWYDNDSVATDYGVRYYEFTFKFTFEVYTYALVDGSGSLNTGIEYEFPNSLVEYNGKANNYASPVITLNGLVLVEGEDYTLSSENVTVGKASLKISGLTSLTGEYTIENAFEIVKGRNDWAEVPSIISWLYNGFQEEINIITAQPTLLDSDTYLWFMISHDSAGADPVSGLEKFHIDSQGRVSADIAKILNTLPAGEYHLIGHVDEADNHYGLENNVTFLIFATTNSWEVTPSVNSWIQGEYKNFKDSIKVESTFGKGTEHIVIKGDDGKTYYDNFKGIDNLKNAKAGRYTLTAEVAGTSDYSELTTYTVIFQIFKAPGLPWWAILLIVVGALGIAALVIFILWKKGVFQIVTEKFVVAIRTRASVDATIAAIRAAKMMEEGRQSVEDAKRRERVEKMRQKEEAQQELSPEERAAQLEAKAQADEAKAEKLRARSEETRAQAAKMRSEEKSEDDNSATQKPETPTEE